MLKYLTYYTVIVHAEYHILCNFPALHYSEMKYFVVKIAPIKEVLCRSAYLATVENNKQY